MAAGRFSADTIETLGKRAALLCSNPDCRALTTGPMVADEGAINIGEAAHIYGLTERSARFNASLSANELSDITNGIWLCRNCHKAADNDELRFSPELLFQWRREHEAAVLKKMGQPGERIRQKLEAEKLRAFESASYLAQQIVIDKPRFWEYKLTVELLRTELGDVVTKWKRLQRGLIVRNGSIVSPENIFEWIEAKNNDASRIANALHPLLRSLNEAFGPPGHPGDEREILEICRLIVAAAQNLLEWEIEIRFSHVPNKYREVVDAMSGLAGRVLEDILKIVPALSDIASMENPAGYHNIIIALDVPDGYVKRIAAALEKIR